MNRCGHIDVNVGGVPAMNGIIAHNPEEGKRGVVWIPMTMVASATALASASAMLTMLLALVHNP